MKSKILKKLLPSSYTLNTAPKPMHAGEVLHLWDCLTASYQLISSAETYLMNSQDREIHLFLKAIVEGARITRIASLEKLLKDAGFIVPPRPGTKTVQGKPGISQEVTLMDEEVLRVLTVMGEALMLLDAKGVASVTSTEALREVFVNLLQNTMKVHGSLIKLGKKRGAFFPPPPATSSPNPLNLGEVYLLMDHLNSRHSAIVLVELYVSNTIDSKIKDILNYNLNRLIFPQLEKLEKLLTKEGFTVSARPVSRAEQQPPDKTGIIVIRDNEIISTVYTALQASLDLNVSSLGSAIREDIRELFESFIFDDIDFINRLVNLDNKRHIMAYPPQVTSKSK